MRTAAPSDGLTRCPLCGYRFAHGVEVCGSCGLGGASCETVGCPHCGYAFPTGSATVAFLKRMFGRLFGGAHVERGD